MQHKKGFTLVEVLIALAILGIVAAATIYVLINAIPKEHEYLAKKPAVTLSYGVKTLLENDRVYPNKAFEGGEKFCDNSAITMSKYSAISALLTANNLPISLITNSSQVTSCLITSML